MNKYDKSLNQKHTYWFSKYICFNCMKKKIIAVILNYTLQKLFTLILFDVLIFILGAVTVDALIYIVGGQDRNTCEVYDSISDKWFYIKNSVLTENDCCGTVFATSLAEDSHLNSENISNYYSY